jgi:hypothetical protein
MRFTCILPASLDSSTPAKTAFQCVKRRQAPNVPTMLSCWFSELKQGEGPSSLANGPSGGRLQRVILCLPWATLRIAPQPPSASSCRLLISDEPFQRLFRSPDRDRHQVHIGNEGPLRYVNSDEPVGLMTRNLTALHLLQARRGLGLGHERRKDPDLHLSGYR